MVRQREPSGLLMTGTIALSFGLVAVLALLVLWVIVRRGKLGGARSSGVRHPVLEPFCLMFTACVAIGLVVCVVLADRRSGHHRAPCSVACGRDADM
ncbi:hypothetical protein [Streptomyces sp. NPDC057257]|uniref:hypothetical protein n=1 Tax=Streptomyces sp. NPDC057257 TaxID=3346071 RepID=UPI0036327426